MSLVLSIIAAGALGAAPLLIDQGRADRVPAPPPAVDRPLDRTALRDEELAQVDAAGSDRPITGIRFLGGEVLAPVARAAEAFIGAPADRRTLQRLAVAMSRAYERSNVALYTVAVPERQPGDGTIEVRVVEGFVEDIVYPKGASPMMRAYAEPLRGNEPLSRRRLERQLSLIRDSAGAKVTAQLLRGRKAGGVILSLAIERERTNITFSYSNRGTQLLGDGQYNAQASAYGLLRDTDETKVQLFAASDLRRYVYGALSHATPVGADGMRLSLSAGLLRTRPRDVPVRGEARTAGVSLSYPLIRGYRRNVTLSAGLDGVDSDAALFGVTSSSARTRTVRLAAGYSETGPKSALSMGATLSRGVGLFGARGVAGFSDPQFAKVNAVASYDQAVGKHLVIRLDAQGQYSRDLLPATERMAFGGTDFGRGFDDAAVTADRGLAGAAEVAVRPPLGKRLSGTEVYGFVDYAMLHVNRRGGVAADYHLASAGGGLRLLLGGKARLGVEGARIAKDPTGGALGAWRINVSWRLAFG